MHSLLEFALLCFTSLFAMMNPFGVAPVFRPMTHDMSFEQARSVARRACVIAFGIFVLFALAGNLIFQFFNISINSLRVVGGVIFFALGYEMLQAKLSRMKLDHVTDVEAYTKDIAITPLAIPLLCGPGAITNAIVLMNDAHGLPQAAMLLVIAAVVLFLNYLGLIGSARLLAALGDAGNKVMMRIMGLILMVIAVEFLVRGLTPIVRGMLAPAVV